MVKTHPKSSIVLKDLSGIRNSSDVILQTELTGSAFTDSKTDVYMCEIVPARFYNTERNQEDLLNEIITQNKEIRRLNAKIKRLEKRIADG